MTDQEQETTAAPEVEAHDEEEVHYCAVHPDRETSLRCNRCGRYMCVECAVQTPVGYRCRECVRQQDDKFFKGTNNDYLITAAVTLVLTGVAAVLIKALSLGILISLIAAIPVGGGIGELALRATGRRRGRASNKIAAAGVIIGGLIGGVVQAYFQYNNLPAAARAARGVVPTLPDFLFQSVVNDWGLLLFIGVVAVIVYGRYKVRI